MQAEILTTEDVCKYLGVSEPTLYRFIKKGTIPKPFKMGGNRWRRSDIESAVAAMAEEANKKIA